MYFNAKNHILFLKIIYSKGKFDRRGKEKNLRVDIGGGN